MFVCDGVFAVVKHFNELIELLSSLLSSYIIL
jgi:hypothetical protein